jgi:hypothetical protein
MLYASIEFFFELLTGIFRHDSIARLSRFTPDAPRPEISPREYTLSSFLLPSFAPCTAFLLNSRVYVIVSNPLSLLTSGRFTCSAELSLSSGEWVRVDHGHEPDGWRFLRSIPSNAGHTGNGLHSFGQRPSYRGNGLSMATAISDGDGHFRWRRPFSSRHFNLCLSRQRAC